MLQHRRSGASVDYMENYYYRGKLFLAFLFFSMMFDNIRYKESFHYYEENYIEDE
jgi:hypothetical protein